MARLLLCALFFAGCGPNYYGESLCESRCGVRLQNAPESRRADLEPWSCEGLQRVEDLTEAAFQEVLDPRVINYCDGIRGWRVYVHQEHYWIGQSGELVAGETYCGSGLMLVNNAPADHGAFPHEAAHALQRCQPMTSGPWEGGHAEWGPQGILSAIDSVWAQGWQRMLDGGFQP